MATLLLALGLVCLLEGLVLALMPGRMEDLLAWLAETPIEARRMIGLLAITGGGALVWLSNWLAA